MFSFMFGVLGSLIFWAIYIVVSFFVALIFTKKYNSSALRVLVTGDTKGESETKISAFMWILLISILWPIGVILLLLWHIFKIFICKALWWVISSASKAVADKIPEIKVSFDKEKEATE